MMLGSRTGAWSGKSLPYDYEVEWLENPPNPSEAWIDSGIKASGDTWVNVDYMINSSASGFIRKAGTDIFWGSDIKYSRSIGFEYQYGYIIPAYFTQYSGWAGDLFAYLSDGLPPNRAVVDLRNGILTINAKNPFVLSDAKTFDSVNNVTFFYSPIGGQGQSKQNGCVRIYEASIGRGGESLHLIPVVSNGQGAMFNTYGRGGMNADGTPRTDGLFVNRGTGAFIIGPDKTT